ncbi:MAG: S41 family peptidase [Ruminococcus sp.]|nr:S41 family peptidase [Ruminococcus sp.]
MELVDIIDVIVCIVYCMALIVLSFISERIKSPKWKLLHLLVPIGALLITKHGPDWALLPLYIGSVIALCGFFTEKDKLRRILALAGAVCMAFSFPTCIFGKQYRAKSYLRDFEKMFDTMREHYVLTEHKGIDWDALYDRYEPQFRDIDRRQDAGANALAWGAFCGEFHDGHVSYTCNYSDVDAQNKAINDALGNDYGLSVMHCSDGSFVAVNVDERLAEYGIRNGTVITAWDGKAPDEVSRTSPLFGSSLFTYDKAFDTIPIRLDSCPDIDNEIFSSGLLCGGIGGDSVEVTFISKNGSEQTAELPVAGKYCDRLADTMAILNQGVNVGNLQWKKVGDTTACLRIKGMSYDSKSYSSADDSAYDEMKDEIREKLAEYQSEGVTDVIIDLRDNSGGSPHMVNGIVSMFAPKGEHYCLTNCVWDDENKCWAKNEDGSYVRGNDITFDGEQLLGDGRVIVIVNSNSVSAADMMTKEMEALDNATVIGFTGPNGSSQAVGYTTSDTGSLCFSNCVVLDEDGSIMIDSGTDRQSSDGDGVTIIPFDSEAVKALFDNGEDYLLSKALSMLEHE